MGKICVTENVTDYFEYLMEMSSRNLANVLIEGLPAKINTLTAYLKDDYYALLPLYNFYFTRDAAVTIGSRALICKMASKVRMRESLITEAIFKNPNFFDSVGNGMRTSSNGIDLLVNRLCKTEGPEKRHVIVQQLPDTPESFIHLDMVFTLLDVDKAMVFEPLILNDNQYQTVHMTIEGGRVTKIKTVNNIPAILKKLGMEVEPIICGGNADEWNQEREQWHSGANFFALSPGKVMAYARNVHTLNELGKMDFEIIPAWDIINGKKDLTKSAKCVVTIDGSELPRGGGGARCMTMPLRRSSVNWPK